VDDRDWETYRTIFTADVVITNGGWRISELVEENFWHLNVPEGFKF
jgi:hypothetical protein